MPTTTTNLGLTLPTPNVDTGWGSTLNTDFTLIDNVFAADGDGTTVGLRIGSAKTLTVVGRMILGGGDGTDTVSAATIRGPERTGTNAAGDNITIDASNGTGTGGSGKIIFRTAPAGTSGTTANTFRNSLVVDKDANVGVGIGNATQALHIYRSTGVDTFVKTENSQGSAYFGSKDDGNTYLFSETNDPVLLGTNNTERFRIAGDGRFGIYDATTLLPNYGTIGQVFSSNGDSSPPSWKGAWTVVEAVNFTGTNNVTVLNLSNYRAIRITITNLNVSVADNNLLLKLYNGASYVNQTGQISWGTSSSNTRTSIGTQSINLTGYSAIQNPNAYLAPTAALSGTITITNFGNAAITLSSYDVAYRQKDNLIVLANGWLTSSNGPYTGVQLATSGTATISGGSMVVEGLPI